MPDENEEQKELTKLLDEMPDDEQDEGAEDEGKEDENKGKKGEGEEENKGDEGEEGSEEGEDGSDEGKDGEEDEFKGKSREEVIKALQDERKKNADLAKGKGKDGEEDDEGKDKGKDKEEEVVIPSPEELQKMSPSDFAKWVLTRIDEGVKKTIESQSKVRDAVRKEITDAKKEHNLGDPDYRKMVLTIIEAASAKGTVMPLKDACKQVDAFLGKHKGKTEGDSEQLSDEEKSRLKKAKAQVESGAGAPTQSESSDAETKRIQKALGGSGSKSPLGGLGI